MTQPRPVKCEKNLLGWFDFIRCKLADNQVKYKELSYYNEKQMIGLLTELENNDYQYLSNTMPIVYTSVTIFSYGWCFVEGTSLIYTHFDDTFTIYVHFAVSTKEGISISSSIARRVSIGQSHFLQPCSEI